MSGTVTEDYVYVREPGALASLITRIIASERVALDTEADSLHHYFEKLCLLQLSAAGEHYLIDPLCGLDLKDLMEALADKPLVLHGADYDLRILRTATGFKARGEIFDTMIAAQLLGMENIGLAALIERYFTIAISKTGQKSDWSRRPLSDRQLRYAANDTRFLEALADRLREELIRKGRLEWLRESCRAVVSAAGRDRVRDPAEDWRIKGSGRLTRRQLAYLRELWRWRNEHARGADLPPFRVLGNQELMEWALWAESHPGAPPGEGPRLPRHITGARLATLEAAGARAAALAEDEWPAVRKREREVPRGDCAATIDRLRAEGARLAQELGLALPILAPRAALEAIARTKPRTVEEIMAQGGLLRWQAELLEGAVKKSLHGSS